MSKLENKLDIAKTDIEIAIKELSSAPDYAMGIISDVKDSLESLLKEYNKGR